MTFITFRDLHHYWWLITHQGPGPVKVPNVHHVPRSRLIERRLHRQSRRQRRQHIRLFRLNEPFKFYTLWPVSYCLKLTIGTTQLFLCRLFSSSLHTTQLPSTSPSRCLNNSSLGFSRHRSSFNESGQERWVAKLILFPLILTHRLFELFSKLTIGTMHLFLCRLFKLAPSNFIAAHLGFQDARQIFIGFNGPGHCLTTRPRKVSHQLIFLSFQRSKYDECCNFWQQLRRLVVYLSRYTIPCHYGISHGHRQLRPAVNRKTNLLAAITYYCYTTWPLLQPSMISKDCERQYGFRRALRLQTTLSNSWPWKFFQVPESQILLARVQPFLHPTWCVLVFVVVILKVRTCQSFFDVNALIY